MPVMPISVPGGGGRGGGGGGGPDGFVTLIAIPMALFAELSSASCDVANSVCPVIAKPVVFHGISTVIDAPTGRPFTVPVPAVGPAHPSVNKTVKRSEEHTSELQSHVNLVCRLLLEKKKKKKKKIKINE